MVVKENKIGYKSWWISIWY